MVRVRKRIFGDKNETVDVFNYISQYIIVVRGIRQHGLVRDEKKRTFAHQCPDRYRCRGHVWDVQHLGKVCLLSFNSSNISHGFTPVHPARKIESHVLA